MHENLNKYTFILGGLSKMYFSLWHDKIDSDDVTWFYNSAKDVPHFCKWGLGLITGGEHISRLVEMPQRKVCLWQTLIEGIIKFGRMKSFDIRLTTLHIRKCIKLLSPMSIEMLMYCCESGRPAGKALLSKLSTRPYVVIKAVFNFITRQKMSQTSVSGGWD